MGSTAHRHNRAAAADRRESRKAGQSAARRVVSRATPAGSAPRISPAGAELIAEDRRQRDEWLTEAMRRTLTPAERGLLRTAAQLLDRLAEA